jgi:K+-transporting ATPase c subunit
MANIRSSCAAREATLQGAGRHEATQRHQILLQTQLVAQNTYNATQGNQDILYDQGSTLDSLQACQSQLLRVSEEQVLRVREMNGLVDKVQKILAG